MQFLVLVLDIDHVGRETIRSLHTDDGRRTEAGPLLSRRGGQLDLFLPSRVDL